MDSIVWNEEPHYVLATDDDQTVAVLLGEQQIQSLGGPLAPDRSRVIVLAVVSLESPEVLQAILIELLDFFVGSRYSLRGIESKAYQ